jgi:hypothetical protein
MGTVTGNYPDAARLVRFKVKLKAKKPDTLELVYDVKHGSIPAIRKGDSIEACGDYVTSNAPYEGNPVSPDGALVHWMHLADGLGHNLGYLIVNDVAYGRNEPIGDSRRIVRRGRGRRIGVDTTRQWRGTWFRSQQLAYDLAACLFNRQSTFLAQDAVC